MIVPRMLTAAVVVIVFASPPATAQQHKTFAAPAWTRGAVCYEIFVRSFYDSDGVGDLRGLIQTLDYINDGDPTSQRDRGATCLWLMPVAQSPSYHRAVLVVANLGTTPQARVQLSSEHKVLSPDRYRARDLLDGLAAPPLTVRANGRIDGYVPVASLPPLASYLYELTPTTQ